MSDDQNTTQNPISTENSIPLSPQEPAEQGTENTAYSEPTEALPEALESSLSDFEVKSNDIPPPDSTHIEPEKEQENQAENEPVLEPQPKADQPPAEIQPLETAPEPATAQMAGNEPLSSQPEPIEPEPIPVIVPNKNKILELLNKAKLAIQSRKRKKLDKIMILFLKKSKITNDEVEKFLHVSDATATRYLSQLEKENRIKQVGKTGKAVMYQKI